MLTHVIHGAHDLRLESAREHALQSNEVRLELAFGGICGTDIHYYSEGRVGNSIVEDPMILGHELSGRVVETGTSVKDLPTGTPVAINPSLPCHDCPQCASNRYNLCANMRYLGSAAFRPHTQGGFQERPVVKRAQCVVIEANADLQLAALAEPYSIALHAVNRAGLHNNAHVLITGAGTIGTLVAIAAKQAGAGDVSVTDINDAALARVRDLCGAKTINVADNPITDAGEYEIAIEASGTVAAFNGALAAVRPGGKMVQVGFVSGDGLDFNRIITREISLYGAYRFLDEFEPAVRSVLSQPALKQAITATVDFTDAERGYRVAQDKSSNLKVMFRNA